MSLPLPDFQDQLMRGEKILWSGRPAGGLMFGPRDLLLVPFSLFWLGFVVFWESSVAKIPNSPVFAKLWGLPFLAFGLYAVAGRFLVDAWVRRRTSYALTNKRVLISRQGPGAKFTALGLDRLPEINLTLRAGGSGTIRFGQQGSAFTRGNGFSVWTPALDPTPQFIAIENAQDVFNQLQRASGKSDD
jgi:hypothetical protein